MIQAFNPVIGLAVNVCVQILSFRCLPALGLLKSVFLGFGASLIYVLGADYFIYVQSAGESWRVLAWNGTADILTCGVLGYGYFHFINLGETGRRVRIVRELLSADGLTMAELLKNYNASQIVEVRFVRLLNSGQIAEQNGKLVIKNQFLLRASHIMVFMKKLLLGKTSEFD